MQSNVYSFKRDTIVISEALKEAKSCSVYNRYGKKDSAYISLLSDELLAMAQQLLGSIEGKFWIEAEKDNYSIHIEAKAERNEITRDELINLSTDKKNSSAKGFMGKLKDVVDLYLHAEIYTPAEAMYMPLGCGINQYEWSLSQYRDQVKDAKEDRAGDWDELEKSVVANIADDIKVGVLGKTVTIVVSKKVQSSVIE